MRPTKAYVVLAMLLAAGCASSPEVSDEAVLAATPALAAAPSSASPSTGSVVPDTVVDANELIANTPAPPICREVLRRNSNVHETLCMSAEHWRIWKQAEARNAAETVRWMQGMGHR